MGAPVKHKTGIAVGIRNPGIPGDGGGDVPDGFIDGASPARRFVPERVNLFQDAVDFPLVFCRTVETVKGDVNRFAPAKNEAVFIRLPARENMVGIHKQPRRVFVSQGVPYFAVREGTAESRVLVKVSADSGLPCDAVSVPADIVRRRRNAPDPSIQEHQRTGMGKPVAANHPPGRGRESAVHPQTRCFAVGHQRRAAPVGAEHEPGQVKTGGRIRGFSVHGDPDHTGKAGISCNMDFHFRRIAEFRPGHLPAEGMPAERFVSFRPAFCAGSQSELHIRHPAGAATAVPGMKAGAA